MPAVSLETLTLSDSSSARSASSSWQLTRYNRRLVSFSFAGGDDLPRELAKGSWGELLLKKLDDYNGPALAIASNWVQVGRGADAVYVFDLLLDSNEIDDLFVENGDPVDCVLELNFSNGGRPGTVKMPATLENRYRLPTEGIPAGSTSSYPPAAIVATKGEVQAVGESLAGKVSRSEANEPLGFAALGADRKLSPDVIPFDPPSELDKDIIGEAGIEIVEDGDSVRFRLGPLDYGTTPPA